MPDQSHIIHQQLQESVENKNKITIVNGNSLSLFSQKKTTNNELSVNQHSGIIHYAPEELVIQVRSGTSIVEIERTLEKHNQQLSFNPPTLSDKTTIGGIIACGLSGSSLPFWGSVKDSILGIRMLNGLAENCVFGGTVIKNVAGFDLSRIQAGAFGQYGIILDIALKVMPKPSHEHSVSINLEEDDAIGIMNQLRQIPSPISAMAFYQNQLNIRLSGFKQSNITFLGQIKHSTKESDSDFWKLINQFKHPIFTLTDNYCLYRVSTPVNEKPLKLGDNQLIDWAGGLRWVTSSKEFKTTHQFETLPPYSKKTSTSNVLDSYKKKLKIAFDPYQLINAD